MRKFCRIVALMLVMALFALPAAYGTEESSSQQEPAQPSASADTGGGSETPPETKNTTETTPTESSAPTTSAPTESSAPTGTMEPENTESPAVTATPTQGIDLPEETDITTDPAPTMPVPEDPTSKPGVRPKPTPYPRKYTNNAPSQRANETLASQWQGKKLLSFGDSITYGAGAGGQGPAVLLAQRYGMSLTDYSRNGAFITSRRVSKSVQLIIRQIERAIQEGAEADLILLQGGCNDIYAGMTTGAVDMQGIIGFSITTYAGAVEYCITMLREAYPEAEIMILRPHKIAALSTSKQEEAGQVLKDACEKWGALYADVFSYTLPAEGESAPYLADHPNKSQYTNYYLPCMEQALLATRQKGWAEP